MRVERPERRITPSREELTREAVGADNPLMCGLCNRLFRSTSNLRFHMVKTHRCGDTDRPLASRGGDCVRRYHCPEVNCPYSEMRGEFFDTLARVKQHYRWKHQEKKSQCHYCSRRFPTAALLSLHLKDCGRFFSCEECSRFYRDLKNLRSHFKKSGHGANSIFSQRQRRLQRGDQQQCAGSSRQSSSAAVIDLDDRPPSPPPLTATTAAAGGPLNLVIVVTGLGGASPAATVASVSASAAAAVANGGGGAIAGGGGGVVSRYRPLAPRPLRTASHACQTDHGAGASAASTAVLYAGSHHHAAPIMVHDHATFRGASCTNYAVVSFHEQSAPQHHQQQQPQSTMHTQTEYTSPIAAEGLSVGIQYSYQSHHGVASQGVCVGAGPSPCGGNNTLGIQAGDSGSFGCQQPPDPLEQLLDMETQTTDAFFGDAFAGGGGLGEPPGIEMETQTYEEFDWETVFGLANRRSTGV